MMPQPASGLIQHLHRVEDRVLAVFLGALVLLAAAQILLRMAFDAGFLWLEPLLRTLVLWVAMFGAMVAAREARHIGLGIAEKILPPAISRMTHFLAYVCAAAVSATLAWQSLRMVLDEREIGTIAFASVPAWCVQAILPFAFAVIAIRFVLHAFRQPRAREVPLDTVA